MFSKIAVHLSLLLYCMSAAVTNAQEESLKKEVSGELTTHEKEPLWVNIFPIGTEVHSLVVDLRNPNSIYGSTYKGVFKNINGKNLWVPFWVAPSEVQKSVIKFDPVNVNIIYIGTSTGRLLRSKDSGKTWEDITGTVKGEIHDIAIHPMSPEIIYVACAEGLFKTLNGGRTWGTIWSGSGDYSRRTGRAHARQVFLNPESPEEVYAIFQHFVGSALYYSKDGGENFDSISPKSIITDIKDGFRARTREIEVEGVSYASLNPHDPGGLFASAYVRRAGVDIHHFLLKSTDRGHSWQALLDRTHVKALTFHPNNKDVIYVVGRDEKEGEADKILKSADGGKEWMHLSSPYSQEINQLVKLHSDTRYPYVNVSDIAVPVPGTVYVSTNYGIYGTIDDGKSWEPKSFGLPVKMSKRRLLAVEASEKFIYISDELGQEGGYWTGSGEGFTWKWCYGPDKKEKYYVSSRVSQIIAIPDQIKYIVSGKGVFKATPSGEYSAIKIPFPTSYSSINLSASSDPKILYAAGDAWAANSILLKSEDGGFSWIEIDLKKSIPRERFGRHRWYEITLLAVNPQSPNILYITVGPENARTVLLKSSDGGNSWIEIDIKGEPKSLVMPKLLAIDPSNSNVVYASNYYNLLRSNDGGRTWNSIKVDDIRVNDITIDPSNPTTLYLATDKGVYRSFDSGKTWQSLNRGLLDTALKRVITSSLMILAQGENGLYKLMEE